MSSEPRETQSFESAQGQADALCDRFEAAWKSGQNPAIEPYLKEYAPAEGPPAPRELLFELIAIDLTHRWKAAAPEGADSMVSTIQQESAAEDSLHASKSTARPLLEGYVVRFPELGPLEQLPLELVVEEYLARRRVGEWPEHAEYSRRFGHFGAELIESLKEIDSQLRPRAKSASGTAPRPVNPVRLGKFELIEPIGQGGFGTVYKALDTELKRTVAVKLPKFGTLGSRDERERFLQEARSAAGLRHPNICPVHESGEHQGQAFIAMGYIRGETLKEWMNGRRITASEAAEIVAKVARATHYAHEHDVIHRDIKPANVMIEAETGEPVLMDFGLAKELGDEAGQLTQTGDVMGTPAYMSPEQAAGRKDQVGKASDIYSLGAVLYELVTGRPPFEGPVGEVLLKVQTEEPARLRSLAPRTHRDLETVCLKALVKDPRGRYSTAAEMAEDLQRFNAGEAILARREGPAGKILRKIRRRPLVSALVAAALLIATVGGFLGFRGIEDRRVTIALAAVESALGAQTWDAAHLERMEALIADLKSVAPEQAADAQSRLQDRYLAAIRERIDQPRLEADGIARIESEIALVQTRYPDEAPGLREELARRRSRWDPVFEISAPFDNREQVFPSSLIAVDGSRLKLQASGSEEPAERILTREACGGHVEIQAEFDPSWTAASSLGVLLGATSTGGYSFVLREEEKEPSSAPEDSVVLTEAPLQPEGADRTLILEIARDGTPLQRVALAASALGEGPLRLRARREGNRLSFWVNDRAPLEFEDMFSLSPAEPGVFGVIWPPDVGLVRLEAARRATPEQASPLEQGDELFGAGQFAEAMARYQESGQNVRDVEFRQEAQLKAALCLVNLKRPEEAAELLGQLTGQDGNRWPPLAGCQLWLLRLRQNKAAEAEAVFESLSARFTFDQLATRIPSEVRDEILRSYRDQMGKAESYLTVRPNRVRDMARALAVEALLSPDGRAQPGTQFQLGRAYELTGDYERAMEIYKQGAEETAWVTPPRLYVRMLCLRGEPQRALDEINRYLADPRFNPVDVDLLRSRARIHAVLKDWQSARADIEEILRAVPPAETIDVELHTETYLMLGFVQEHLRGKAAAEEAWRSLLADLRPHLRDRGIGISTPTDFLIMASLADELTAEDADNFVASFSSRGQAGSLLPFARTLVGNDSVTAVFRQMWRTPRGRRWAEKIAFRQMPAAERVRIPIQLAAAEYFRQRAFGSNLSDQQETLVWDLCEEILATVFQTGQLSQAQMVQLALAWKGQTNWLGWASVAPTLDPELRGPIAYVLAHRYLRMKKPDDAPMFLRTALEDAAEDALLAELAQTDLDLLEANQGRLLVESDFPESLRLLVTQDGKEVAGLDAAAGQSLDLPVGKYELQLVDPPTGVSLSTNRITVTPAGRHPVRVQWLWKPGAAEHALPGLVPRPARLPGIGRWQIETVEPRGTVHGVSFSPSGDLVACANGLAIRIYDAATQELVRLFLGHTGPCFSTSFSPDRQWLASGSWDNTVRLWNLETGRAGPVLRGHASQVWCVAWSPDGSKLASAGDNTVRLWNADGTLDRVFERQSGTVFSVAWSPDGQWLASTDGDRRVVQIWTSDGRPVRALEHTEAPRRVAWSPDGKWLAVATLDPPRIVSWNTNNWKSSPVVLGEYGFSGAVLGWSPDSRKLLFSGPGYKVCVWDLETRSSDVLGDCEWPTSVAWHPRSSQVVSAGGSGLLSFWDTEDDTTCVPLGFAGGHVRSVDWSPDGKRIVAGAHDNTVRLCDAASGAPLNVLRGHTQPVLSVAWNPDGRQIASGSQDHTIRLWDASDGSPQGVLDAHSSIVRSVVWSPNGQRLASGGDDKKLIVWNPAEGKPDVVLEADERVTGVCWSPDARWIVAGMGGGNVRVWQADGTPERVLECDNRALAFSPDGAWLSTGNREKNPALQLFDTGNWQPGPVLSGTTNYHVTPVAWCPDGEHLAASRGHEIKVFAIDGGPSLLLNGHADTICTLAVSPTSTPTLASSSRDNTLRLWDTETGQPIWVALALPDGKAAVFTSGGEMIGEEDEEIDEHLVYVVEQPDGEQKLLSPAEFRKMIDNQPGAATSKRRPERSEVSSQGAPGSREKR